MANWLGQGIDILGTQLGLPEIVLPGQTKGLSELIGGGNTLNTQNYQYANNNNPLANYAPSFITGGTNNPSGLYIPQNTSQTQLDPTYKSTTPVPKRTTGGGVPPPSGGSNGGGGPSGPSQSDLDQQVRNDINNAYGGYFASLDAQLGSIGDQRTQQEGIVNSQLTQGQNTLTGQFNQGNQALAVEDRKNVENQTKSLADLADNIRNQFTAGRLFLGARGAGDSSAANQYSYAIGKMGNKARGDVLNQTRSIANDISDRVFKLKNIYDTEMRNLQETTNQKIMEVANWFSQAQQQIQNMKAQGMLAKGQDIASLSKQALSIAQNKLLMAQQEAANFKQGLNTWAMNHSNSINELKGNLAAMSNYTAPGVNQPTINGTISTDGGGNITGPGLGYRNTAGQVWTDTKKYPIGQYQGSDGKTYTRYSDGTSGPTQWAWGSLA